MRDAVDQVITTNVRPMLQLHGGDIELVDVTGDGVVTVRLIGNCGSCPASHSTMENLVEVLLKEKVPSVKEVKAVTQAISEELIQEALRILRKEA